MDAITTKALTKKFRTKKRKLVLALDHLDLSIQRGEVFGYLGPNGAGKSTTIKILMGLIRSTSGAALLNGVESSRAEARRNVGYLPENPSFYDYLTASEYLALVGKINGMTQNEIRTRSESVLNRMGLWESRKRPIRGYSKGMVQRVGLAQILLHDPDVYILDEPMSGLDPLGRALVKEIIRELKEAGKSVFFSTHITNDVEAVCDRVGIIVKGKLQSVERVDAIMTSGIVGYQVRHRLPGTARIDDTEVAKENLQQFMTGLTQRGEEIVLIEPLRRNLEEFFLEKVRQGDSVFK